MRIVRTADELIVEIDRLRAAHEQPIVIALDGRSGAGKSTISLQIAAALDTIVIEGDEFYSGGSFDVWERRSAAEKAQECIDWRRMRTEALEPLRAGRPATWRIFDWDSMAGLSSTTRSRNPKPVVILDGVYSSRPELASLLGATVLVRLPDDVRLQRLRKREQEWFIEQWHRVWDEAEDWYFTNVRPAEAFDLVIERV